CKYFRAGKFGKKKISTDFKKEPNNVMSIKGYGKAQIVEKGGKKKKNKLNIHYQTLFKKLTIKEDYHAFYNK
ncbi:hypothetical protein ACEF20_12420, partial [Staphylococcus epidermidis]